MPGEINNITTISKNNAGFPGYLDFNLLRTEGIKYLGQLSGKIWTDHNLHDPGITILELLCYALLDLGYRTHLPVEDILAKNPLASASEDNFFTPAQVLTNNPLTINDYRKLLIDIPGIRNAWLIPAMDIKDICKQARPQEKDKPGNNRNPDGSEIPGTRDMITPCEDFLNGIYHVYIETEVDLDKDFKNDDPNVEESDRQKFIQHITGEVRKVLMAHRNLCEDFADIFILCKLETGVCADIELEEGADVEEVYVNIANRLREYFSATPRFYTLGQMLEKGWAMDDIFAGRPYSQFSHGFIDICELESITLKKEIHTSDIYHSLFDVKGVRKISRLKFRNCGKPCLSMDGKKDTDWVIHLPHNHVPDFSLSCSGFEFTRNGLPVNIDVDKFNTQIELSWLHNGKVKYKMPSAYLDAALPQGKFHSDLADYLSVQNDLPAVYGIGEGELPEDAPNLRKAQALQLRGYLMFFDQLLANYLSQLQNIRQLFSFEHPADPKSQHTYFLNTITTIPEMDNLLRFGEGNGLGPAGTVLAIPVDKNIWDLTDFTLQPAAAIITGFPPFEFNNLFGIYEAIDLLRNDLVHEGESQVVIKSAADGKFLYALISSTDEFVMVGQKEFDSLDDAEKHASSVQYAGVFEKNYRSFITATNNFTFDLDLTLNTYTDYLGVLVETEELYLRRRKDFLSHLLSRFSEQFTDFVIYNWKSVMGVTDIYAAEQFLTQYPDLSRNRGRAYNYLLDGFVNDNISGFEKKVHAIAGIYPGKKNHLCHFVVEPFDETYFFDPFFKLSNTLKSLHHGNTTGRSSRSTNTDARKFFVYRLVDKDHIPAVFSLNFNDKASALNNRKLLAEVTKKLIDQLPQLIQDKDHFEEVSASGKYRYVIMLREINSLPGDWTLFKSQATYPSPAEATNAYRENVVTLLSYASDKLNYGEYIINENDAPTDKTIAFIPDITRQALESVFGAAWNDELVKFLKIYPLRMINDTSIEFAQIFCKEYTKPMPGEEDKPEHLKYYFNLPIDDDIKGSWTSTEYFNSFEEAIEEFNFFQMLVGYVGNYYADCACTGFLDNEKVIHSYSYKLFIREVLAQGVDVFETAEDAWGLRGIEKFICAVQAGQAFWKYQRDKQCYSFYVTCGSGEFLHPCTYESEEIRKKVMILLMEQGIEFIGKQYYGYSVANGTLLDAEGKPFAKLDLQKTPSKDLCDLFITVAEQLKDNKNKTSYTQQGFLRLDLKVAGIMIQSVESRPELSDEEIKEWIRQWEKTLMYWSCYFPITRTKSSDTKGEIPRYEYCIEIKLPGFNECEDKKLDNFRVTESRALHTKNICHIAWKSNCCYNSCAEALLALENAWKLLTDKKNYKPVFDCEDFSYGIALHSFNPSFVGINQVPGKQSDIIAINPQCYPSESETCKAVERAIKLVDIQGMHLIEHILLRPFKAEDCRCRKELATCGTDCNFPHWIHVDPECEGQDIHVCFKPGHDSYSFIATIILPSWSSRFRQEKERLLFEKLLYREAPAHVLLRILWLRPIDFCRIESVFFDWEKWMAGAYTCNHDFSLCRFIELLFSTYYDCLPACVDCLPCRELEPPKKGCWDDDKDRQVRPVGFIDQINELYCFEDYCRETTTTTPKEQPNKKPRKGLLKKDKPKKAKPVDAKITRASAAATKKKKGK